MPRPKKTDAQIAEMRAHILDAAHAILLEKGHEALSARAIADRLGIAHMGLFTYFPNQAAILSALAEREMAQIQAHQAAFEDRAESEDILDVVRDSLLYLPDYAKTYPNIFRLAWVRPLARAKDPQLNPGRADSNVQHMTRLIVLGIDRGVFEERDPVIAAVTAISMMVSPSILFYNGRIPTADLRDRLVEEMLVAAMRYLQKAET